MQFRGRVLGRHVEDTEFDPLPRNREKTRESERICKVHRNKGDNFVLLAHPDFCTLNFHFCKCPSVSQSHSHLLPMIHFCFLFMLKLGFFSFCTERNPRSINVDIYWFSKVPLNRNFKFLNVHNKSLTIIAAFPHS